MKRLPRVIKPFPRFLLGLPTLDYRLFMTLLILALTTSSGQVWSSPVDFKAQSIRIAMLQEPPSLDSSTATDLVRFFVLVHTTEGLLRYDRRGRLVVGVA